MERSLRNLAAAALAVVLHLIGLVVLLSLAPDLTPLREAPIFEVVLAPPLATRRPTPPAQPAVARGEASGQAPGPRTSPASPTAIAPPPAVPDVEAQAQAARLRSALRQTFGCSQPDFARLNETERAACLARFANGAEAAPYRPPLTASDKQQTLERAAARKRADRAYRESTTPPLGTDTTGGGPAMNPLPDL
ncbi:MULTISPECIES: hypothetical protein [Alphaproteobacteria]|uniref:hypothetical protein n=1 Tax=Alphaproteobacteria TaxID=28211 RepID=UPI002731DE29|nr:MULTISPECIES: hypothetical protein [Alphaproteobacteria]MDP1616611.1 hypothetical protein [Phenylobacterium sp.]MDP2049635.1 hypothetical protein [Cypionkella sp.]